MKVLILGPGSSRGTLDAPVVAGFLDTLSKVHPKWEADYPALARVVRDTEQLDEKGSTSPGLDAIWTRIDYYAKLQTSLRRSDYGAEAAYEMYRAVIDVYALTNEIAGIPTEAEDSRRRFTLLKLIAELGSGDVLVSFNWDVAAEHLANRILRIPVLQDPHLDQPHIRLVKPHGSLSWRHEGTQVTWHDNGAPRLAPLASNEVGPPCEGGRRHSVVPLILGAVPIKSELLREIQGPHRDVFDLVAAQWAEAMSAIEWATEVVIAGYRFPPEDAYGRFLLREAVRRRSLPRPSIRFYELDDCKRVPNPRDVTQQAIASIWGPPPADYEGPIGPHAGEA